MSLSSCRIAACCLLAVLWHRAAWAEPITYTEQAIATGTLDGREFIDKLVTISLTADTDSVIEAAPGFFTNAGQGTVSIGARAASFTDPLETFVYVNPFGTVIGITDPSAFADVLDTSLAPNFFYDLTTPLARVTGASLTSPGASFATSAGYLNLATADPSRFSATLQDVPEPASLPVFLGGAALLLGARRRRAITAP